MAAAVDRQAPVAVCCTPDRFDYAQDVTHCPRMRAVRQLYTLCTYLHPPA